MSNQPRTLTSSDLMVTDQVLQHILHPSPQSAAFTRYGEYSVDHSTGVPKIEIPLYTLDTGDYILPIKLSYHASGIKVMDVSSPVGLGWSLMAGGIITRTVCASADKSSAAYRLYFKSRADVDAALSDAGKDAEWWNNVFAESDAFDSESDRYFYSFARKSGIFRYATTDKPGIGVQTGSIYTIPHEPIKIEESADGFKITDTDGTQYYFEAAEISGVSASPMVTTAWHLTKIITAERKNEILFNYSTGQIYQVRLRSEVYEEGTCHSWEPQAMTESQSYLRAFDSKYEWYKYRVPRLDSITWGNVRINFTYELDRLDAQKERLKSISVIDSQVRVRFVSFANSGYFGTSEKNYRLKLDSVTLCGKTSTPSETFTFAYNSIIPPNHYNFNPTSSLTGLDRYSHEDYWGYYNGQNNEHQIPDGIIPGTATADRNARENYMKMCSLESITYPTGGKTVFTMEANKVGNRLVGGLRVKTISSYDYDGTLLEQKTYEYSSAVESIPITDELYSFDEDVWYFVSYPGSGIMEDSICETHSFAVSSPILPLTGWSGSPVFYACVTEYIGGTSASNLGKRVYRYMQDFESTYPESDEDWYALPLHMRFYSALYNNDEGIVRPLLTDEEYHRREPDGTYTPVRVERCSYTEFVPPQDHFLSGVRLVRRGKGRIFTNQVLTNSSAPYPDMDTYKDNIYYTNVLCYRKIRMLTARTETEYRQAEGSCLEVSKTTTYTYDATLRTLMPVSESFVNSDGVVLKTEYGYPFNRSDSPYVEMTAQGRVDLRLTERHLYAGVQQSLRATSYKQVGNSPNFFYVPDKITETTGAQPSNSDNTRDLVSFDLYDAVSGKLLHYIARGGKQYMVQWGYGRRYPVAVVEGLDYATFSNAVNLLLRNQIANCTTSNAKNLLAQMRSLVEALPTPSLVTTQLYQPGVGVTSTTAPSGATTTFLYDSLGRLVKTGDNQGEIESVSYALASVSGEEWTPNRITRMVKKNAPSSDTLRITTIESFDGLGRSRLSCALDASGSAGNSLHTMTSYDKAGRVVKQWLPAVSASDILTEEAFRNASEATYGQAQTRAFSETLFEPSGMERITSAYGPGDEWYPGHPVATDWLTNKVATDSVLCCKRYHPNSDNTELVVEDGIYPEASLLVEHITDEDNNSTYIFTDKAGRKILERKLSSASVRHDTYYVYDKKGRLRFVLQPQYQEESNASKFAFRYRYDQKDNTIWQGVPGAVSVRTVYDNTGRPVYSQTGVQQSEGKWTFFTYDNLSRLVSTGESTSQSADGTVHIRNWYDNYGFSGSGGFANSLYPQSGSFARGELTGQEVMVHHPSELALGAEKAYRTFEYDSRKHIVRSVENNPVSSSYGYNTVTTVWSHTGKPTSITTVYGAGSSSALTVAKTYTYDQIDRLIRINEAVNNGASSILAEYVYDHLGRLQTRKLAGSSSSLLTQSISYDIRNAITALAGGRFAESLVYGNATSGKGFSGNVTALSWGSNPSAVNKNYTFSYDGLDRMLSALYSGNGSSRSEIISGYDLNGNILGISRDGEQAVAMSYTGNLLTSVGGSACGYDTGGRLISDARKGIVSIAYTSSNTPLRLTFADGSTILYAYTADGVRLRSAHSGGTIRDWCGDAVFENGVRKMIINEEGYLDCSAGNVMRFFVKDHIGSIRSVIDSAGAVLESTDYYPLGGLYNSSGSVQPYKFSGKELDSFKGLDTLDFGARSYDPSVGRWLTPDPLAEKYCSMSPYLYCAGNPVKFVDPDGRAWAPKYDMLYKGCVIGYTWVDESIAYDDNGKLKEGLYHQAIFFADNGTFDKNNKYNIGSATAYVYLQDGTIICYDACTYPSDIKKYPTIPDGRYEASVGMHRGSYKALKMYDVGKSLRNNTIDLGFKNPAYSDGRTYAGGINIHKAGIKNYTGDGGGEKPVSAGCMLIDRSLWENFISNFLTPDQKGNTVSVTVSRTFNAPNKPKDWTKYLQYEK